MIWRYNEWILNTHEIYEQNCIYYIDKLSLKEGNNDSEILFTFMF